MTKTFAQTCKERAEKATEGPWHIGHVDEDSGSVEIDSVHGRLIALVEERQNQSFICNSREDVPELCRRLERACTELRLANAVIQQTDCYNTFQRLNKVADELEAIPGGNRLKTKTLGDVKIKLRDDT